MQLSSQPIRAYPRNPQALLHLWEFENLLYPNIVPTWRQKKSGQHDQLET